MNEEEETISYLPEGSKGAEQIALEKSYMRHSALTDPDKSFPKGRIGTREIINKIRNGYSIALMVDQRVGEGIKVPFFNTLAQTTTIPAQLALKYDCELVPISLERKRDINFEMTVHEPYKIQKTESSDQDTKNITIKINQIIEKMIIKNPTQWLWSHDRWK